MAGPLTFQMIQNNKKTSQWKIFFFEVEYWNTHSEMCSKRLSSFSGFCQQPGTIPKLLHNDDGLSWYVRTNSQILSIGKELQLRIRAWSLCFIRRRWLWISNQANPGGHIFRDFDFWRYRSYPYSNTLLLFKQKGTFGTTRNVVLYLSASY